MEATGFPDLPVLQRPVVLTPSPAWQKQEAEAKASWSIEKEQEAAQKLLETRKAAAAAVPFEAFLETERLRMEGGFKADPSIEQLVLIN